MGIQLIKGVVIGAWLACIVVGLCWGSYKLGFSDGKEQMISECSYYGRVGIDGTTYLLCSGVVNTEAMLPSVDESNAKWYSKENRDKHKKSRK